MHFANLDLILSRNYYNSVHGFFFIFFFISEEFSQNTDQLLCPIIKCLYLFFITIMNYASVTFLYQIDEMKLHVQIVHVFFFLSLYFI